jgi:hypothetical protein
LNILQYAQIYSNISLSGGREGLSGVTGGPSGRASEQPYLKEEISALDWGKAFESKDVCKGGLNVEGSQSRELALLSFIVKEIRGFDDPHLWPGPITGIQRESGIPSRLKYRDGDCIARPEG